MIQNLNDISELNSNYQINSKVVNGIYSLDLDIKVPGQIRTEIRVYTDSYSRR